MCQSGQLPQQNLLGEPRKAPPRPAFPTPPRFSLPHPVYHPRPSLLKKTPPNEDLPPRGGSPKGPHPPCRSLPHPLLSRLLPQTLPPPQSSSVALLPAESTPLQNFSHSPCSARTALQGPPVLGALPLRVPGPSPPSPSGLTSKSAGPGPDPRGREPASSHPSPSPRGQCPNAQCQRDGHLPSASRRIRPPSESDAQGPAAPT